MDTEEYGQWWSKYLRSASIRAFACVPIKQRVHQRGDYFSAYSAEYLLVPGLGQITQLLGPNHYSSKARKAAAMASSSTSAAASKTLRPPPPLTSLRACRRPWASSSSRNQRRLFAPTTPASSVSPPRRQAAPRAVPRPTPASPPRRRLLHCNPAAAPLPTGYLHARSVATIRPMV